MRPSFLS
jgi:hypothetical protein